jgi:nucleoid-associated protein YgaU
MRKVDVSRPLPSAPLQGARRERRRGDAVRGLAAGLLMTAIVIGVPLALLMVIGNPLPDLSGKNLLSGRQSSEFVIKVIACVAWLAWAQVAACLLVELAAGVRGTGMPWRVPFAAAAQQDFARRLVTAVLLLATASHGLQSAAAPLAAANRPVASAGQLGGTVQYGQAPVGQHTGATAPRAAQHRTGAGDVAGLGAGVSTARGATDRTGAATKTYIVMPPQGRHHDSLWGIAERYLGNGIRYKEIYELNKGRLQPDGERLTLESLIYPGWTLVLPSDARGEGLVELGGPGPLAGTAGTPGHQTPGRPAGTGGTGQAGTGQVGVPAGPAGLAPISITTPASGTVGGQQGPAPERSPSIPWDLVGAELLAAGLLEVLLGLRRRRSKARFAGGPVAAPDADAAGAEVAIRIGADPAAAAFLDGALRLLARGLAEAERPVPEIYAARVSDERLELLLAVPQDTAPAPFTVEGGGGRWALSRDVALPDAAGIPALLPGLVSIGGDGRGRVFVDLEAAGGAICVEGDHDAARSVVAAAAVELITNRWSDDMHVTLVGFGRALAPLDPRRLRCVDTLGEVLEAVTDRLSESQQALAAAGVGSVLTGRVRGVRGAMTPEFLVLAAPPEAAELAELQAWARSGHGAPLGILIAGSVESAQWRFTVSDDGILQTGPLGLRVGAQQLSPRSYSALARLLHAEAAATAAAERQRAGLAPVEPITANGAAPLVPQETITPTVPRPIDPQEPYGVLVRVFGEPTVDGGDALAPGTPLAVEILSYLALAGRVSPRNLAAAVWPYGVTEAERDASIGRLASWLGADSAGRPRLAYTDGLLTLSADVRLDWHLFVAYAERGDDSDLLRAMELARGALAEPHLARRYTWLARESVSRELPAYVVDVAHRLAQRYLARREFDGAAAAARAGLRVEPLSELLWDDLVTAVRNRDGDTAAERAAAEKAAALTAA